MTADLCTGETQRTQRFIYSLRLCGEKQRPGFALLLVYLMAAMIAIALYAELPRVAFEAQRQKEQLLIDRGEQYARAIKVYFRKFQNRYPASIDQLENTNNIRFLRHRYKDPMTGKDEWRLIHAGPGGIFTDSLTQKLPQVKNAPGTPVSEMSQPASATAEQATAGADPQRPVPLWLRQKGAAPRLPGQAPEEADPYAEPPPEQPAEAAEYPAPQEIQPEDSGNPDTQQAETDAPVLAQPGFVPAPQQPPGQAPVAGPNPGVVRPPFQPGSMPGQPFRPGLVAGQPLQPGQPGYAPGQTVQPGQPILPGQAGTVIQPGGPVPYVPGQPLSSQPGAMRFGRPNQPNPLYQSAPVPTGGDQGAANTSLSGPAAQRAPTFSSTVAQGIMNQMQGGQQIGGGIAGVASKSEEEGIKVYNERSKYKEWEFIYDPRKDQTNALGMPGPVPMGPGPANPLNPPSPAKPDTANAVK